MLQLMSGDRISTIKGDNLDCAIWISKISRSSKFNAHQILIPLSTPQILIPSLQESPSRTEKREARRWEKRVAGRNALLGETRCWERSASLGETRCWEKRVAGRNALLGEARCWEKRVAGRNALLGEKRVAGRNALLAEMLWALALALAVGTVAAMGTGRKLFVLHTDDSSSANCKWKFVFDEEDRENATIEWFVTQLVNSNQISIELNRIKSIEVFHTMNNMYATIDDAALRGLLSTNNPTHLLLRMHPPSSASETKMITGRSFDILSKGLSIGEHSRVVVQEVSDADKGTGLVSWDGSIVLGKYLEIHPDIVRNKKVLELGAGTGVAGLSAGLLGASKVLLTDLQYTLDNLRRNIAETVNANTHLPNLSQSLSAVHLDWSDFHTYPESDWEVVLGADIVWLEELVPALAQCISHFAAPGKTVLLAHQVFHMYLEVLWLLM
jgi:predicted nicotinamide N-methyase